MSNSDNDLAAADPHYLDSAGRDWGVSVLLKVNIVTCSLSFAGSLVMIIPFILFKQLRKIRHRLILGMAVNDLLQAASVLIPSVWSTYHGAIATNSPGCNADSFFYLTFVVASCFWTLTIAVTTYITLVQPMSRIADYMHRSRSIYIIWISIWLICLINAGIGTALNVSVDGGGFCFFPMVEPYLYGNLVLFVPRAGTFAIIIFIYLRLYIFFRQQASSHHKSESRLHESSFHVPVSTPASELQSSMPMNQSHPFLEDQQAAVHSGHQPVDLTKPPSRPSQAQMTAMLQHKLSEYQFTRKVSRNDSADSSTLVAPSTRRLSNWAYPERRKQSSRLSDMTHLDTFNSSSDNPPILRRDSALVLQDSADILNSPTGFEEQLVLLKSGDTDIPSNVDTREVGSSIAPASDNAGIPNRPLAIEVGPPVIHWHPPAPSDSLPATPFRGIVSMGDGVSPGADSLLTLTNRTDGRSEFPDLTLASQSAGDGKRDSMVMGLWEALASVDPVDSDDAGLAEACAEKGRRLSASEENKRVSYLMLLYPLAYGIILAVSIARLAVTLATKASPSPWLQILNRVCVLGTGVVDACIYTIIEWRFRASSRNAARSRTQSEDTRTKEGRY